MARRDTPSKSTLPKDCPFCGSEKVDICRTNPNACWVRCCDCGADAPSHRTRTGALKNWNRRDGIGLTASIDQDDDREEKKFCDAIKKARGQ